MQTGYIGLIILILCVVSFVGNWIPASATGCIGCLLMVLFRVCTFEETFSGFSNSIVLLMASAMIVGTAMFKTGAAQMVGRMVIRWSHGKEKTFLMVSCLVSGVLAMFLANTAVLAAFIPIVDSVCRTSGRMKRKNLILPIACSVMLGGECTLIGCTPQLTANSLMSSIAGKEFGMWTLTAPGLCIFALFLVYLYFFGYQSGNRIWGARPETALDIDQKKVDSVMKTDYDRKKLIVMFVILILMIVSYAASLLPAAETAMCAAALCVLTGCCTVGDILHEMNWESVVFLASCLGLANALTAGNSSQIIGTAMTSVLSGANSPLIVFAVLVLITLFISQFVTNSTAIIITLPVALSICSACGFQPLPFGIGITFAASVACCSPLAAAQIAMTRVAGYEFSDYLRFSLLPTGIMYAGILTCVPLFYPLR